MDREGVGTSNFRTTTGHFFQNVEMVFLVDQNVEKGKDQNIESIHKSDQNVENKKHQLPMAYYLWLPRPVGV